MYIWLLMPGRGKGCREEEVKKDHDYCEARYSDSCLWSSWMGGVVAVGLIHAWVQAGCILRFVSVLSGFISTRQVLSAR